MRKLLGSRARTFSSLIIAVPLLVTSAKSCLARPYAIVQITPNLASNPDFSGCLDGYYRFSCSAADTKSYVEARIRLRRLKFRHTNGFLGDLLHPSARIRFDGALFVGCSRNASDALTIKELFPEEKSSLVKLAFRFAMVENGIDVEKNTRDLFLAASNPRADSYKRNAAKLLCFIHRDIASHYIMKLQHLRNGSPDKELQILIMERGLDLSGRQTDSHQASE